MRVEVEYRMASKENYLLYKEETSSTLSFLQYQNIIYTFNYNFRDYILETGDKEKLLWGFGSFTISKKKRKRYKTLPNGEEKVNLPVDWKRTKEEGRYIYHLNSHTEGYTFKWRWFPRSARFKHSDIWVFKPSRVSSRMINYYIASKKSQNIYKEWE